MLVANPDTPTITPTETKPTNPKDAQATDRIDLSCVPQTAIVHMAHAFTEGDLKYGAYNYREAGVSVRIYIGALFRHVFKWFNGEDHDPKTGVHHLANALACLAVILDAQLCGKLTDDRPPRAPISQLITEMEPKVGFLRKMLGHLKPKKYTINGVVEPK